MPLLQPHDEMEDWKVIGPTKLSDWAVSPLAEEYAAMVLLVDDQAMIGEAVRRALAGQPEMDLHYCANPAEAVATAKGVKPTVILQDLVMPGIDGLELVRRYRADPATSLIPIIVLSTNEEPAIKSEAFKAGANDYLVKLPDRIELIARIRYHSKAYLNQLQRDEAYRALRESQRQLMQSNLELQRLTTIDSLTGLSNRRHFDEYLAAEWKRAMRTQEPLSILMIDVDYFKDYNDSYGHLAGDMVLRGVAESIQRSCRRQTDFAARFGGEEFVVVLGATALAECGKIAENLRQDIEDLQTPHCRSGVGRYITVSIGVASGGAEYGQSMVSLVDAADKALYDAKKAGRNRVVMA
jgi:two-component system, chemotaxis family, response regulator WspR